MPEPVFLCADIGTSSLKGALFRLSGECLCRARAEFSASAGRLFQDWNAGEWLSAFGRLVRELTAAADRAERGGVSVGGIVISGNGPTLVPLGAGGEPVHPVLLWIDGRAEHLSGEKSLFLPKAAWLMRERPAVYEKTVLFLGCPEYLVCCLTGEKHAFSPSPEFSEYIWTERSCAACGLDPRKFPPAISTGAEAGRVSPSAAREFGIPRGAPVYAAGPDFLMTLLGTACVRPGRSCDRAGTSEGVNTCTARPVLSAKLRCLPHIIPGYWNAASLLFSTGRLFEWFRAASSQADVPYDALLAGIQEAARQEFQARLPWFFPLAETSAGGEKPDGGFPGMFFHEGKGFYLDSGVIQRYGKQALGLAVARAIGFAVRQAVCDLRTQGLMIEELRVSGGQAKNPLWNQLKADLTGAALLVPEIEDAELVGGLAAGLKGCGMYADLAGAAEALVRFKTRCRPDPEKKAFYADMFEEYKNTMAGIASGE
ncbi:MAG: FGGY-family carbohydrate kinase [Spirochaetales bacterium]|jgi:xylulokinase|nr:FGGY-family carbohydrate kinase [Spirochaetales bacterium]